MTMSGMGVDATVQAQYARLVERVLDYCKQAVSGLTYEELCDTQNRRTNSIAFDVWHVQRTIDNIIHFAFDRDQPIWLTQGFDQSWQLPRVEQGTNMTPEEAYNLRFPGPEEFDRYTEALRDGVVPRIAAMSDEYLTTFQLFRPWGEISRMEAIGHGLIGHANGH
ncbi:MAG TPA: hypothetical protein DGL25_05960, partial [Dehalococcoidia bacterium]|nr:hypothetical protein [Dehalococcoidia bacterium]